MLRFINILRFDPFSFNRPSTGSPGRFSRFALASEHPGSIVKSKALGEMNWILIWGLQSCWATAETRSSSKMHSGTGASAPVERRGRTDSDVATQVELMVQEMILTCVRLFKQLRRQCTLQKPDACLRCIILTWDYNAFDLFRRWWPDVKLTLTVMNSIVLERLVF